MLNDTEDLVLVRWTKTGKKNELAVQDLEEIDGVWVGSRCTMKWGRQSWKGTILDVERREAEPEKENDYSDTDDDNMPIAVLASKLPIFKYCSNDSFFVGYFNNTSSICFNVIFFALKW